MAIAAPPPIPPQAASILELRAQAQAQTQPELVLDHLGFRLHVFGSQAVVADQLKRAIQSTATVSDAVRMIGYLHYAAGRPATLIRYAWAGASDRDIFVQVVPGEIGEVIAPVPLKAYFDSLRNAGPLTQTALERKRTLAGIHSDRAGEDYKPVFKPGSGNTVSLDLGEAQPGPSRTTVVGALSNYGNRYAGPELASAGVRHSFGSGVEALLSATATRPSNGYAYYDGSGSASQVTPYGIFEIEARYADFKQAPTDNRLDGELGSIAASWSLPLYSDLQQRLNLRLRASYDSLGIDARLADAAADDEALLPALLRQLGLLPGAVNTDGELLSERYALLDLTLSYLQRLRIADHATELQAGLSLRKGLGAAEASPVTAADLEYWLLKPSLNLRYTLTSSWALLGDVDAQLSDRVLPQQQQYVIGGPGNAYAYEPGAAVGDRGINLRLGGEWKGGKDSWADRYGIRQRLYVEYGSATLQRNDATESSRRIEIADLAATVDVRLLSWLSAAASFSQPIRVFDEKRSPDPATENRWFLQLAARY